MNSDLKDILFWFTGLGGALFAISMMVQCQQNQDAVYAKAATECGRAGGLWDDVRGNCEMPTRRR